MKIDQVDSEEDDEEEEEEEEEEEDAFGLDDVLDELEEMETNVELVERVYSIDLPFVNDSHSKTKRKMNEKRFVFLFLLSSN